MAKRVGNLYVSLTARTGAFAKSMARAMKDVEQLAQKFEKIGSKASMFGAALTGPIVAALVAAGKNSEKVQAQLDRVKAAFGALAGEVAQAVLPIVTRFADTIAGVAGWLHNLDDETKKSIFGFIELAVKVLAVAAAFGQVANVVGTLAKVGGLIASALGSPLIPILAGLAALAFIAGFIYEAWSTNLGGIKDKFKAVWGWIVDNVGLLAKAFVSVFRFVQDTLTKLWKWIFDKFRQLGDALGIDLGITDFLDDVVDTLNGLTYADSWADMWTSFKDGAATAFDFSMKGIQKLVDKAKGAFAGLGSFDGKGMFLAPEETVGAGDNGRAALSSRFMGGIASQGAETGLGKSFRETEANISAAGQKDAMVSAANALSGAAGKMGKAGEVMGAAAEGFKSGGIWGALIAVIVDLVAGSKQFQAALEPLNEGLTQLGDAFGALFGSGKKLNEAHNKIFQPIFKLIETIFGGISDALGVLAPVFEALGAVIEPLLVIVGDVLKPIFEILGGLFKGVALVILVIIKAIASVWNLMIEAVAGIIGVFDPTAAWDFRKKKIDTTKMDDSLRKLTESTVEQTEAQKENAEAVNEATAALLNVPTGYKVALARFNAISTGGSGAGALAAAAGGGGGGGVVIHGNVEISADDAEELAKELAELKRKSHNRKGDD